MFQTHRFIHLLRNGWSKAFSSSCRHHSASTHTYFTSTSNIFKYNTNNNLSNYKLFAKYYFITQPLNFPLNDSICFKNDQRQFCKNQNTDLFSRQTQALLNKFNVICRKEAICTIWSKPSPPARVYLVDMCDDVIWIKCDLRVISYKIQDHQKILKWSIFTTFI